MIKIGIRNNLLYPLLFVICLGARRIVKLILERIIDYEGPFLLAFLMFFFEFIFSGIFTFYIYRKKKKKSKVIGITLIKNEKELNRKDSKCKIILLIFLAACIELIGAIDRRYLINKISKEDEEADHINTRLRSFEILISSLLSYFILHIKIYKHHIVTLIIIGVSLICGLLIEIHIQKNNIIWETILILIISILSRVFLDIIEKYLFDKDFIDVYKITAFEGFIDTILILFSYISKSARDEINELINSNKIVFALILLIIYGFLSVFKNIYRRFTLNEYSPMTRALAESIFDPFIIIFDFIDHKKYNDEEGRICYTLFFIFSIIMVFCSCVYNEFLVLYFCDMEHDTYIEISKRAKEKEERNDYDNIEEEDKEKMGIY